jgi:hypothetical protein
VGAIYIDAAPESYVHQATDLDFIRKLVGSTAVGAISTPPKPGELSGFTLDTVDIDSLKSCKPGDCMLQLTLEDIRQLQRSAPWKSSDPAAAANEFLQQTTMKMLREYMQGGNPALGVYDDKVAPTDVANEFRAMVENNKALPVELAKLQKYLVEYPNGRPADTTDTFYWANVKFGFKPTLRLVHEVTLRGGPQDDIAYTVVRKQLYASHYFKTAMDYSFCVPATNGQQHGFYLVSILSSEIGLEGMKGTLLHAVGVTRSLIELQKSMGTIKSSLEEKH